MDSACEGTNQQPLMNQETKRITSASIRVQACLVITSLIFIYKGVCQLVQNQILFFTLICTGSFGEDNAVNAYEHYEYISDKYVIQIYECIQNRRSGGNEICQISQTTHQ